MKEIEAILKNKHTVEHNKDNILKGFTLTSTFQEIAKLMINREDNNFYDPPFQTDLDDNKINGIISAFEKNECFFMITGTITIGIHKIDKDSTYYLLDGQHRVNAIKKLNKNNHISPISITFIYINSDEEARTIFEQLNKDSSKSKTYISLPTFEKIKHEKLKNALETKYKKCVGLTNTDKEDLYTINEFVNTITEENFFEYHKDDSNDEIIRYIENENKKFFNHIGYLESANKNKNDIYSAVEKRCIKHLCSIFFKHNNFIEYLCYKKITPIHEFKNQRIPITQKERQNIWKKVFKSSIEGICPIFGCEKTLENKKWGFVCGHVISVKNGGDNNIDNIRPICAQCNQEMSDENWNDYNEKQKKICIWKNEYPNDNDGNCKICNKNITKDNFYIDETISKKGIIGYNIICKKCNNKDKKYNSNNL
jgi:hypothetical protein